MSKAINIRTAVLHDFLMQLAQCSDALVYQDAQGRWHFVNGYTANVTTGAEFPNRFPDAVKVISLGTWETLNQTTGYFCTDSDGNASIAEIDLVAPDNITRQYYSFNRMLHLERARIKGGRNTTLIQYMLSNCENLRYIDLTGFDVSKASTFVSVFRHDVSLVSVDMTGCDTSLAYNFSGTFNNCSSLSDFAAPKKGTCKADLSLSYSNHLTPASVQGIIDWLYDFSTNEPDAYDPTATYALGDLVTKDGGTYICSTAITTAEAWNSSHWKETTKTLTLHATAKAAYNAVHGENACQTAVTAKGWTLA